MDQPIYENTPENLENLNIISEGEIKYDNGTIKTIQNTRLVVKISECFFVFSW